MSHNLERLVLRLYILAPRIEADQGKLARARNQPILYLHPYCTQNGCSTLPYHRGPSTLASSAAITPHAPRVKMFFISVL